ncbi:MAG: cytochrome P460 family protein [Deltaproteobacteria bacterium]|nr:cytochrome P460 family protein [Deltaproteobacteria bacterium]
MPRYSPQSPFALVMLLALMTTFPLVGCSGAGVSRSQREAENADFPSGYRKWKKINQAPIVRETERQARDIFANDVALRREPGKDFPVGSILVKEERILAQDPAGQLVPRDVFRVSVMFKARMGEGSRWAFKAFDPSTKKEMSLDRVDPEGCYFCHVDAKDKDYVFSDIR